MSIADALYVAYGLAVIGLAVWAKRWLRRDKPYVPWCDTCATRHWPFEGHLDEDIW